MSRIEVELQEWMGSDAAIARAAWTSTYDKERREIKTEDPERVADLVKRCVREGHTTPLECVVFRFWIRMPIFTDRQHMTHRMATHNGLSGRYRTLPEDFYDIPPDVRELLERVGCGNIQHEYAVACEAAHEAYAGWLSRLRTLERQGIIDNAEYKRAREVLRGVVPTSFMTERVTVMNLLSFANYQRLRNSSHAQPEIRRVAELMLRSVHATKVCPVALGALMDAGWTLAHKNNDWTTGS